VEKLTVKNLGPIKDFTMETNRLTVLIGPQASGKSLLAQMLYFFNGVSSFVAERFSEKLSSASEVEKVLYSILSDIRGVPINSYFNAASELSYWGRDEFVITGSQSPKFQQMHNYVFGLTKQWDDNRSLLTSAQNLTQIFIPTERIVYTYLHAKKNSMLYADFQPLPFRKFSEQLDHSKREYYKYSLDYLFDENAPYHVDEYPTRKYDGLIVIDKLQESALDGKAFLSSGDYKEWYWKIKGEGKGRIPIEGTSSGQMAAWPFFILASVFGLKNQEHTFYFEEPETHLHPNAQVEVVKTIAYLISRGHRFVITTHSPFILYVINNLIQAHIAYEGNPPEGEFSIDPDLVAAYCLGGNPRSIVDKETRLLDLDEIDDVFDDIGEQFQSMLEKAYEKRKKK